MLVCCWGKEKGERKKGKEKERMLLEKGESDEEHGIGWLGK